MKRLVRDNSRILLSRFPVVEVRFREDETVGETGLLGLSAPAVQHHRIQIKAFDREPRKAGFAKPPRHANLRVTVPRSNTQEGG